MNKNLLIEKYSNSLFDVSLKEKNIDLVRKELQDLGEVLKSFPELMKNLSSPIRTDSQIIAIANNIVEKKKFSKITKNFLHTIAKNRRFPCFSDIVSKFELLCNEHYNKVEFKITTARKISEKKLAEIQKSLEEITNKKVLLKHGVDKEMITGFTLKHDSILIDNSYENRLKQMKKLLFQQLELYKLSEMN